jgi:hypothetical protein
VGRDDGNFEVWTLGDAAGHSDAGGAPTLLYETCLTESVQAIDSGNITGSEFNELVVTTFSGKVIGFTPDTAAQDPTGAEIARIEDKPQLASGGGKPPPPKKTAADESQLKEEKEKRYKILESEVDRLKQSLEKSKQ